MTFGPYRLEADGGRLWKGTELVALQPRPFAVLSYLAARPGALISRDALLETLWAGTYVTKAVLKVVVRAIREALDDDVEAPRYIETVGREGYRFIGAATDGTRAVQAPSIPSAAVPMVGRAGDLAVLRQALSQVAAGARTLVLVSGDAGIGKTTLLDRFFEDVETEGGTWVARGQCVDPCGEGEAYLPVLEAIGRLARESDQFAEILRRHAPTWVSHLPALAPAVGVRRRAGPANATTPTRMLREMADALEVFTQRHALVLALEDLQWCDRSTVDLIAYMARRRQQPARLMMVGSLRPIELIVHQHPLRVVAQELRASGQCAVVALELLSTAEVAAYVDARFRGAPADAIRQLASRIH